MGLGNQYISEDEFQGLLSRLNIDFSSEKGEESARSLLKRSTADMESDLCRRFMVPLVAQAGGPYSTAPEFARSKVLNTLEAKIRQNIGTDNNRNLVIDSTQKYIDTAKYSYQDHLKALLDPEAMFGFRLQPQAQGAQVPVQSIGLGRADNRTHYRPGYSRLNEDL